MTKAADFRFWQLLLVVTAFMVETALFAGSDTGHVSTLPRCRITITHVEVIPERDRARVVCVARLTNTTGMSFLIKIDSLPVACAHARFCSLSNVHYEISASTDLDGQVWADFSGDGLPAISPHPLPERRSDLPPPTFLLKPGTQHAVRFTLLTGAGGIVPINAAFLKPDIHLSQPTLLTYEVFGVLEAVTTADQPASEICISGWGRTPVEWMKTTQVR